MQRHHIHVLARVFCLLLVVILLSCALLLMWRTEVSNGEGLSQFFIFSGVAIKIRALSHLWKMSLTARVHGG